MEIYVISYLFCGENKWFIKYSIFNYGIIEWKGFLRVFSLVFFLI